MTERVDLLLVREFVNLCEKKMIFSPFFNELWCFFLLLLLLSFSFFFFYKFYRVLLVFSLKGPVKGVVFLSHARSTNAFG